MALINLKVVFLKNDYTQENFSDQHKQVKPEAPAAYQTDSKQQLCLTQYISPDYFSTIR